MDQKQFLLNKRPYRFRQKDIEVLQKQKQEQKIQTTMKTSILDEEKSVSRVKNNVFLNIQSNGDVYNNAQVVRIKSVSRRKNY